MRMRAELCANHPTGERKNADPFPTVSKGGSPVAIEGGGGGKKGVAGRLRILKEEGTGNIGRNQFYFQVWGGQKTVA